MTPFEAIRSRVTAEEVGRRYGLHFDRSGKRAFCPWHDDGRHAALSFGRRDGGCHCFVCLNGGSCIDLAAKLLGVSIIDAAKTINADFGLGLDFGTPPPVRVGPSPAEIQQARKEAKNRRWSMLCDVAREADAELRATADPNKSWDDPRFVQVLRAMAAANEQLENIDDS